MILTTTNSIEGFRIIDYKGIVTGVSAQQQKVTFSFSTSKYLDSLNKSVNDVKEEAFNKLKENAKALNANAIVGIKIDFEVLATSAVNMISVTGTAVNVVSEK
ncbi:YbjQ family protein [Lacinutrix jangbogonensis]|uniref:YbjQ family protein n=1 Tax=Lacinutrix jangbogonensis TaxID=1469557 RepID=UPI00053D70C2|nr:heavy metal-binding domain-containing protein [Lacinutrix jangbogonensis]